MSEWIFLSGTPSILLIVPHFSLFPTQWDIIAECINDIKSVLFIKMNRKKSDILTFNLLAFFQRLPSESQLCYRV